MMKPAGKQHKTFINNDFMFDMLIGLARARTLPLLCRKKGTKIYKTYIIGQKPQYSSNSK